MTHLVFVNRFFYPDNSATSQMLSEICFAMAEKGYRVSVVTSKQYYSPDQCQGPLKYAETVRGVNIIRLPAIGLGKANLLGRFIDYVVFLIQAAFYLLLHLRPGRLVIAKTDPPMLGVFLWPFVCIRGAVLVNWFQDLFPEVLMESSHDTKGWGSRLLLRLRDWNCRHALMNVTLSEAMAEYLKNRGIPKEKITVIPNYALSDLKPVAHNENSVRKKLSLSDTFVVGYSGNLGRAHEWKTVLGAAEALSSNEDLRFLFFGGGVGMEALRSEAENRSLRNIEFHPYQPHHLLSQSLSAIDVHLVSLQPELSDYIFPSKVYGIMAVRRPMVFIGSKMDAIGRFLQNTRCGLVVDVGDVDALCDAILQLKADKGLYSEIADNGFYEYEGRYNLARVSDQWERSLVSLQKSSKQ